MKKLIVVTALLVIAQSVSAQESASESKFGLGFSLPNGSPLLSFVSEHWRIEPGLFFSSSHNEFQYSSQPTQVSTNTSAGVNLGIYYQTKLEHNLFFFGGPMLQLGMSSSTLGLDTSTTTSKGISSGASALIGLEYQFSPHFGIAGETSLGFRITGRPSSDGPGGSSSLGYNISTGAGLTARYYF